MVCSLDFHMAFTKSLSSPVSRFPFIKVPYDTHSGIFARCWGEMPLKKRHLLCLHSGNKNLSAVSAKEDCDEYPRISVETMKNCIPKSESQLEIHRSRSPTLKV